MDKRLIFPGGEIQITNDEINLMPEAAQAGINGFLSGLGLGADYIVQGVSASITPGVSCTVAAGYVFLNGELLKVDADTVTDRIAGTDLWQFQKEVRNNLGEWERNYRDGSTNNIAEIIRAIPVNVASITGLNITGATIIDIINPQTNWNTADSTDRSFIANKPTPIELAYTNAITSWAYDSTIAIPHAIGKAPAFAVLMLRAKSSNNGYTTGDEIQATIGAHDFENGGGANQWAMQFVLDGTSSGELVIGASKMYAANRSTQDRFEVEVSQWTLVVKIFA